MFKVSRGRADAGKTARLRKCDSDSARVGRIIIRVVLLVATSAVTVPAPQAAHLGRPAPPARLSESASLRVGSAQVPARGSLRKFLHLFRFYPFNFRISHPLVSAERPERVFRVGPGLEPRGASQFILPSRADGLHNLNRGWAGSGSMDQLGRLPLGVLNR